MNSGEKLCIVHLCGGISTPKISVPFLPDRPHHRLGWVGLHLGAQGDAHGRVRVAAAVARTHAEYPGIGEVLRQLSRQEASLSCSHLQLASAGKGNPFILARTSGHVDGWVAIRGASEAGGGAEEAMVQQMTTL